MSRSSVALIGLTLTTLLVTAGPADATPPGENGRIVYFRIDYSDPPGTLSIRSIAPDGTKDRRVRRQGIPEWSPDGSQLALIRQSGRVQRVVLIDLATGDRSVVVRADEIAGGRWFGSLAFSPAGDQLVLCVVIPAGWYTRLYTVGTDGAGLSLVSDRPECYADWSVTNRIVATLGWSQLARKIVTMDPDGSNRQLAVANPTGGLGPDYTVAPSWAPDGIRFVYSAWGKKRQQDLYSVRGDGTGGVRLTRTPRLTEHNPVYSPDGAMIVFTRLPRRSYKPLPSDMFLMASDGSAIERLTRTPNRAERARQWKTV